MFLIYMNICVHFNYFYRVNINVPFTYAYVPYSLFIFIIITIIHYTFNNYYKNEFEFTVLITSFYSLINSKLNFKNNCRLLFF